MERSFSHRKQSLAPDYTVSLWRSRQYLNQPLNTILRLKSPNVLNLIGKARKSKFINDVAVLSTGTVLAQAVTFLAAPILTRLYSPEAFGLFAVFAALAGSLAPAATGRYEVAMIVPKDAGLAGELFGVALWFCGVFSILFFTTIWVLQPYLLVWLDAAALGGWILLAPVLLMVMGLLNLAEFLANRHSRFHLIARTKIIQTVTTVGSNIAFGLAGIGFFGLLIGGILGPAIGFVYVLSRQSEIIRQLDLSWSRHKLVAARKYIDFPVFNASTGLLNGLMTSMPVFFMIHFFPSAVVGYFALVVRVLYAPASIVSDAVSRIHLRRVVDLANDKLPILPHILRLTGWLFAASMIPAALFIIWGPQLFQLIFGDRWEEAGQIARIMAFAVSVRFVASTLSSTFGATRNNGLAALWRTTAFVSTFLVLGVFANHDDPMKFIVALVLNDICLYVLQYLLILRAATNPRI